MEEKYTENPEIITRVDVVQSKMMIEISLIDVEKEDINLMMDEKGFFLSAPTESGTDYVAAVSFLRSVKPSEAKAVLGEGYLKVEVPFKDPLENYIKVVVE
ncbi:MAG TPA: hypothetical protein VK435_07620 [Thermodesulfovibrionales bacterium]|nr:hypothetical protein [Thermodesulfovibrionales bacterium]